MSNFKDLGLSEPILRALSEMGFEEPTEVQQRAIPPALEGKDVIVMSKTGSGKTAVFGVSVLQMTDPSDPGPQCLILTPTRELAVQVDNDLKKMAKYTKHLTTAVFGQHNINTEIRALGQNNAIVTGTPGRVYDHIENGNLKTSNIRFLVLDEVDRMMDMGFIDQVRRIIHTLPRNRTTLLFSATIPEEIRRLCQRYINDPVSIEIESATRTVDTIEQMYYRVERNEKRTQLNRLLLMEQPETCMIFCNTKAAVDQVQSYLTRKGYASRALHGDIPQNKRLKNIQQFKQGDYHILVATDVAARGIHVEGLSLVVNYDVPNELDSYIHRIGRTGRAGQKGRAISLVTTDDLMTLYAIEEHIGALIPEADLPTDEELAEVKESAEEWVKAHAIKVKPVEADAHKKTGNRKKSGSRNANGRNAEGKGSDNRSSRSAEGRSDSKIKDSRSTDGKGAGNKSSGRSQGTRYSGSKSTGPKSAGEGRKASDKAGYSRQYKDGSRPAPNTAKDTSVPVQTANVPENKKQPQDTAAKKSWFKRIFDKIMGR